MAGQKQGPLLEKGDTMWLLLWVFSVVASFVVGVVLALAFRSKAPRFGLTEFRRVASSARAAVDGLVDGGVIASLYGERRLATERAVVRAQVGTIEGLGYENDVVADADEERGENAAFREKAEANITAHFEEISKLEMMIAEEGDAIADVNRRDDQLAADLALLG
ncbi:MAG: hypothetical protein A3D48_02380 [Candidatus Yanofskybacteria bacterium RIFCSPHIGHO2_02_FULL_43_17]|nr:MAG: hypothetical protein A3D48_02380 [Candidatus Yanofskybacteria bacterium RIFCSPHIGHO2_02_FULL_43_17]